MSKFCPECGTEISDKVKFCPECGANFDSFSVKKDAESTVEESKKDIRIDKSQKIEETKIETNTTGTPYNLKNFVVYGVIVVVVIIIFLMAMAFFAGMSGNLHSSNSPSTSYSKTSSTNFIVPTTESQTERNTRIANEIVANYHQTHTYSLNDLYVCGDMASDVWDMLKAQGINAKINVGNVDKDVKNITDANHAWVLAEVAPNQYLALEATGGYSVRQTDNPRYYYGWSFYNPKQLKNYLQLNKQRNDAIDKYNSALSDYNNFFAQYKKANILTQLSWKGELDDKIVILNQRIQDINDINQQISALLSNL
jgi:hypothetical protein